jgi:hypothetical protein
MPSACLMSESFTTLYSRIPIVIKLFKSASVCDDCYHKPLASVPHSVISSRLTFPKIVLAMGPCSLQDIHRIAKASQYSLGCVGGSTVILGKVT